MEKNVVFHQKPVNFDNAVEAYKNAGLELIKIESNDLARIKKGDTELIDKVLNLNTFIL